MAALDHTQGRIVKWTRPCQVFQQHQYKHLARMRFDEGQSDIRHDLLRIPYTHCIMTCQKR